MRQFGKRTTSLVGMLALALAVWGNAGWTREARAEEIKTEPVEIGRATFEVPVTWERQPPKGAFRILQWGIPKAEGDSSIPVCYVSRLDGTGGGVQPNIDRWIGQFEDASKPKQESFEKDKIKITTLDISGTYKETMGGPFAGGQVIERKDYRMLAAVLEIPGEDAIYFIRLTGPKKSVAAQEEIWSQLLQSAKRS